MVRFIFCNNNATEHIKQLTGDQSGEGINAPTKPYLVDTTHFLSRYSAYTGLIGFIIFRNSTSASYLNSRNLSGVFSLMTSLVNAFSVVHI